MKSGMFFLSAFTLSALLVSGCLDTGRVKDDNEEMLVDQKKAGTVVYDKIVKHAIEELLQRHHEKVVNGGQGKFLVAFVGIDNKGFEELRDHEEAIYDNVETILVNAGYYKVVSKRFVDTARREAGLRSAEDIFLREPQAKFISVMQKEGLSPDYFIWGKMTTQTSEHEGYFSETKERRYSYSMEMVDTHSGEVVTKVANSVTKEYVNW